MLRLSIESTDIETKSGTSKRTGEAYSIREQEAWVYLIDPKTDKEQRHPTKIKISLEKEQEPYRIGMYIVSPASLYVGRFGSLDVGSLRLRPVNPAAAAKVAGAAAAAA